MDRTDNVAARAGLAARGGGARRLRLPTDRTTRLGVVALVALALLAFLVRLVGLLRAEGLGAVLGYDDTVYFSAAVAFVEGRLPYRDFTIMHPPGILYLLSPFALAGRATGDLAALELARLGFMVLGGVNTILVGLVGRRLGWGTALCAAAVYAVWVVPASWDRTTYLVAPQATLLLLAMLQLTARARGELTPRRAALAGACIGVAGVIQVWTVIPAAVIFGWLVVTGRSAPRRLVRLAGSYVAGGLVAAFALLLPFLVTTGARMIQLTIAAQLVRTGDFKTGRIERLRYLEGVPVNGVLARWIPDVAVIGLLVGVAMLVGIVAWKRSEIRLWVAVLAAQTWFLMITPVFFPHYGGWTAPLAALSIGATAATMIGWLAPARRRIAGVAFAGGLALLLVVGVRPDGRRAPVSTTTPDLSGARCVTADNPMLLIATGTLRRDLQRGCALLVNPGGLSHLFNADREGGKVSRRLQPEYQAEMRDYYGSSDAALFNRLEEDAFSDETWAHLVAVLPVRRQVGPVTVLLRAAP